MLRALGLAALLAVAAAAPADAALRLTAPRPGTELESFQHARAHGARLAVRGRASKREPVTVTAPCVLRVCTAQAVADRKGRWSVTLDLVLPARGRRLTVRAVSASGLTAERSIRVLAPPPPGPLPGRRWLIMTGDSLAVGTAAALPGTLADLNVTTNAVSGRTLAQGMTVLRDTPLPARPILAFSLFTNDDPRRLPALEAAVRRSLARAGSRGCALWATIRRPRGRGPSYSPANALLERLAAEPEPAGRLQLVPWAAYVRRHRGLLRRDGVHATPAGYAARARLYAQAARRCPT